MSELRPLLFVFVHFSFDLQLMTCPGQTVFESRVRDARTTEGWMRQSDGKKKGGRKGNGPYLGELDYSCDPTILFFYIFVSFITSKNNQTALGHIQKGAAPNMIHAWHTKSISMNQSEHEYASPEAVHVLLPVSLSRTCEFKPPSIACVLSIHRFLPMPTDESFPRYPILFLRFSHTFVSPTFQI